MPVISVEVAEDVAKKFTPYSIVSTEELKQEIYDDDDVYYRIIDF